METGLRKDASGNLVPPHFIQNVSVAHNGRTVMSAEWGPAVSKNPFLHFRFAGGKPGEKIAVTWTDSKGDKRTDEASIVA
jgi:sulfur-oxidizing protein SoxZ